MPIGGGVRWRNYLLTAEHVLVDPQGLPHKRLFLTNYNFSKTVEVEDFQTINLAEDLAVVPMPGSTWSILGTSVLRVARSAKEHMAAITDVRGNRSVGVVTQGVAFGSMMYYGTTRPGYSGCPYMIGKAVAGIHSRSGLIGKANLGHDMAYILCLLRQLEEGVLEDTAEWLSDVVQRGRAKVTWKTTGDPDEYIVRVDGQYHILDRSQCREAGVFDLEQGGDDFFPRYDDDAGDTFEARAPRGCKHVATSVTDADLGLVKVQGTQTTKEVVRKALVQLAQVREVAHRALPVKKSQATQVTPAKTLRACQVQTDETMMPGQFEANDLKEAEKQVQTTSTSTLPGNSGDGAGPSQTQQGFQEGAKAPASKPGKGKRRKTRKSLDPATLKLATQIAEMLQKKIQIGNTISDSELDSSVE